MSKNGAETKGIIIEQNYTSNKDAENYFLVQQQSGAIQSIKVSEIAETRKEENPKFDPKFDILLKEGDVVINRQEILMVDVKEKEENLVLDSIGSKVVIAKDANNNTKVTVEYRSVNGSNIETYQLVRVSQYTDKKSKESYYYFTYRDLVNAAVRPVSLETSVNHTTKAEYIVGGQGIFALYDVKNKKAIPFTIK
jgi:hypothetical protein